MDLGKLVTAWYGQKKIRASVCMKQGWCCPRSKLLIGIPNGHPHNHANEAEGAELQTSRLQNPVYVHIYSIHLKVATIVGLFGKKMSKTVSAPQLDMGYQTPTVTLFEAYW